MPPPLVRLSLRLSLHRHLSSRPSRASCPAGCCVTTHQANASRLPAPLPLITPLPLTAPRLCLLSGWLLRHLSSSCASASRCAPLAPLIRLVVASPLITPPPPPVCLHLRLSTTASHHAPLVPLVRLVVASPFAMPPPPPVRLRLRLSSHRCPSCASFPAVFASPLVTPPSPSIRLSSTSHCNAASHCAPLTPLVWLVVASPLFTPPPPVSLRLRLSSRPSCASCPAGCRITSHHTTATTRLPVPLTLIVLPHLISPLSRSSWLLRHLSSRRRLPSACVSACHCTAASHRAPLSPLIRLVAVSPLVTPLPPIHLRLCLSAHHRLSSRPLALLVRLVVASPLITLPPPVRRHL
jgi:hypothetical protein